MDRVISGPISPLDRYTGVGGVAVGGSGSVNGDAAVTAYGGVSRSKVGIASGVAIAGGDGKILLEEVNIPSSVTPSVTGASSLYTGQTSVYTISNYDIGTTYTVTGTLGTVSRSGESISYTAGSVVGSGAVVVNGKSVSVALSKAVPTISGPATVNVMQAATYTITNYATGAIYDVSATLGTVSRSGATITYTAGGDGGAGTLVVNGVTKNISIAAAVPTLTGPSTVSISTAGTFTISNYVAGATYTCSATLGTVSRNGATITYTAGAVVGAASLTVNGTVVNFSVVDYHPAAPTITSPTNGATGRPKTVTFTSSAFAVISGSDSHASSDWQLSTDSGFATIVQSVTADTTNKTSWTTAALAVSTTYYARVRYKGTSYGYGAWSSTVSFTTAAVFVPSSEQKKLLASDPAIGDCLGYSIALSSDGSYAIVGGWVYSDTYSHHGVTYIFLRTGTTWTQQAKLLHNDSNYRRDSGQAVSISGDGSYAVIGLGAVAYKVFVFVRTGTTWAQQAALTPINQGYQDGFGTSVSISGDGVYLVVGGPRYSDSAVLQGAAYVFLRSGTTWTQQAKLLASDAADRDVFGNSVSISADSSYAVVGAYAKSSYEGAAYIFLRTGTTWTQQAKLVPKDPVYQSGFGYSVSISSDGSYAVVGMADPFSSNNYQGAAYIFLRTGTTWTQQAKLLTSDLAADDCLGWSVSISGDGGRAVIGAYNKTGTYSHQGAAYIFLRSGTTWTQQAKLLASDPAGSDWFGYSVSISSDGSYAIVGACRNTGTYSYQGAAYIYA